MEVFVLNANTLSNMSFVFAFAFYSKEQLERLHTVHCPKQNNTAFLAQISSTITQSTKALYVLHIQ